MVSNWIPNPEIGWKRLCLLPTSCFHNTKIQHIAVQYVFVVQVVRYIDDYSSRATNYTLHLPREPSIALNPSLNQISLFLKHGAVFLNFRRAWSTLSSKLCFLQIKTAVMHNYLSKRILDVTYLKIEFKRGKIFLDQVCLAHLSG